MFGEAAWQATRVLASSSALFYTHEALYYPHIWLSTVSLGKVTVLEMGGGVAQQWNALSRTELYP